MPRTYVALDLETTGLDPDHDTIMEVGALRFDLDGNCERFHTLVDPKQRIPYRIQRLTGIADEMVAGAPSVAEVAGDLERFIDGSPIVGQNVTFDLRFLERANVVSDAPAYDTQELASLLLPDLVEHSLRGIARYLGIDFPVQHRALEDADAARMVFVALRERLAALPSTLLDEAQRIAAKTDWSLRDLLGELTDESPVREGDAGGLMHGAVRPPAQYGSAIYGHSGDPQGVDPDEIEALLTGGRAYALDGFEERPQQVAMARAVAETLSEGGQLVVEAGTGIGKSLAYLLPAARLAMHNGDRVVVSTNTINLQEQLLGQDIPLLRPLLGAGDQLRAAQLKGRRNYLCLLRWSALRHAPDHTVDEARLLVRLLLWLPHTETGDRSELRLASGEEAVWHRISAQNEACLATPCPFVKDGSCFLLRARKRAEAAHLLVVNHALMLSDIAVGGGVIPEYDHLIVDEAQHLEDEATSQFGFSAREEETTGLLDRISARHGGLVASIRNAARGLASGQPETNELLNLTSELEKQVNEARELLPDFFLRLAGFVRQQTDAAGDYEQRLLLTRAMRVQPDWADIEMAWEAASGALEGALRTLQLVHEALQAADPSSVLSVESLAGEAGELIQTGALLRTGIASVVLRDDANTIAWLVQQRAGNGVGLSAAPLRVAELLQERLLSKKHATVLTSATLTVEGQFDYVRQALGLEGARELQLGSPFDYARSTMVLVPQDMPEPNQPGYMAAVQQSLIEMVRASNGRALVLFTSHSSLRGAYTGIKGSLEEHGILVLGHALDGSPRQLLNALRDQPHTVVLGTASFWEGIDVVGDALSLLVIARLPFSVPDDPVFQSRSELFDEPFGQYAVPQAVLRFKQGFGRLIRRKTDRGVMVVLDSRVASKSYGQAFLRSLPACSIPRIRAREASSLISQWLGDET